MAPLIHCHHKQTTMAQAVALSGAVIISQEGSRLVYKGKCEKCGSISNSEVSTHSVSKGQTYGSTYHCHKCKNAQRIQIKGF